MLGGRIQDPSLSRQHSPFDPGNRKSQVHPGLPSRGHPDYLGGPSPGSPTRRAGKKRTLGVRPGQGTNGRHPGSGTEPRPSRVKAWVRDSPQGGRLASVNGRPEGPGGDPAFATLPALLTFEAPPLRG